MAAKVTPTASTPLNPFSTTTRWNDKEMTWLETNCARLCGTCHTGVCWGKMWIVASLIAGTLCLSLFIASEKNDLSPALKIISGVGVAISVVCLLIGRCITIYYTPSTQINAPFTGRPLKTLEYPETQLQEHQSEKAGKSFGRKCAQWCQN